MRAIVITAFLLSACVSIQTKKRLEINQDQCNVDNRADYYFPINLKFTTLVKDAETLSVSASTLAPCARVEDFKVEVVLEGITTVMTFNQDRSKITHSTVRSGEMTMEEMANWWGGFVKDFKSVVVGADVEVTNDKAVIQVNFMDPKLLMHLEALKLPFTENVYEYDLDAMLEERRPKKQPQVEVKQMEMTPAMMEMFKQQLMSKENMAQMLDQFKTGNAQVQTTTPDGNKIQMVIQRQIVSTLKEQEKKHFLI